MDTEWTQNLTFHPCISEIEGMENYSSNTSTYDYPVISDELIKCLERDYPDKLPRAYKDNYELGVLIGQQMIIDKLKVEKKFNEEKDLKEEDEEDTTLT